MQETDVASSQREIDPSSSSKTGSAHGTIYSIAINCETLFLKYSESTREFGHLISACYRRFLNWASFLGVFAHESASLDRRLQYEFDIRELVVSMLLVLQRNLRRGELLY
jgi:hypothetical protein